MIDPAALPMVLDVLTGWLDRREREAIAYLIEENRLLRRHPGPRRLHLTDDDRRRLAARTYPVGRAALRGLPPVPHRPTSWQTFLKAHWGVIAGADFFTTEVWT